MPDNPHDRSGDRYDGLRDLQGRQGGRRPRQEPRRAGTTGPRRPTWDLPADATGQHGHPGAARSRPEPASRLGPDRAGGPGPDRASRLGPDRASRPRPTGGRGAGLGALRVSGRRPWARRVLVGLNILIAVALVGGVSAFGYAEYRLSQIHRVSLPGLTAARSGPFTMLVVGSDTRALTGAGNGQFGSKTLNPGQRSDTIMLVRVVPSSRHIELLSIPRDLWVHIPGLGPSKINAAFDSGPSLLVKTIEQDLGIPVNHFVEVNFDSFRQISDAVGGVKVWFPTPARDAYSNLSIPTAGCWSLVGNQALAFVRSRHYTYETNGQWTEQGLSDLARIQRQQVFVKKLFKKAETEFTNPVALNGIIAGVTRNLVVDKGFSPTQMLGLAQDFRTADISGIPTETLPVNNYVVDGQDALSLQQPQAGAMIRQFNTLGDQVASRTPTRTTPAAGSGASKGGGAPAPSQVAVEVANGSGVTGQAASTAAALARLGYRTTVQQQSPGYGHASTEILYAPDAYADARAVASRLVGATTLLEDATLTPTPYNLEVITGRDDKGVGPAHAVSTTSTPQAAPTSAGPYYLPGPQPTAAQLAACH